MKSLYTIITLTLLSQMAFAQKSRWYNYYDFIDQISGNLFSGAANQTILLPIWHDPEILLSKPSGPGYINYLSVAQVVDPSAPEFNDTILVNAVNNVASGGGNMMYVSDTDAYIVDSISVVGYYNIIKPSHVTADSLILSITPNKRYYADTAPWISSFGVTDTLYAFAPTNVDSLNRCAYSDTSIYPGKTWTIAITPSMATGGISIYKFAPPGGSVLIPAGYHAAITVTFKSMDSWIKNVDSIEEYNAFMPLFGYEYPYPAGGYMTYQRKTYKKDCNGTALMHSNDTSHYIPSIIDQGRNLPVSKFYPYEYANIGALISCISCKSIVTGVNDITSVMSKLSVYPNPADKELIIPIVLSKPTDIEINLINGLGQSLETKKISKALNEKIVFNIEDLAQGIYFYSIRADSKQQIGRFAIVHH